MVSTKRQILGIILAMIGFIGIAVICGLPAWKVSAFIGSNIVTSQIFWEGLWMNCVVESTGQMQCKVYDSLLALPQDLQAARAMVVISLVVGIFGIILATCGGKCTNFIGDEDSKAKVAIASGVLFIISGFMVLIPVCWTTDAIVRDFYNPIFLDAQKRELGACIYIGWGCAAALFIGGGLLCSSCPANDEDTPYNVRYTPTKTARSVDSSKAYV